MWVPAPPVATASDLLGGALLPAVVACYALPYMVRVRRLARRGRPVPRPRIVAFGGGLLALLVALSPPIGGADDELLIAHMAEHLLMVDVAALLLVVGLTGPVLAPVLRVRWIAPLRTLAHPLVGAPLWAMNLYLWHVPVLHEAAVRHELVHFLQHATFLALGMAVWMPLFGPLPKPAWFGNLARLLYIVAVRFTGAVLANVLLWSGTVLYPVYGDGAGLAPLEDQSFAGALMMIEESLLTLGLFGWLFLRAAREGEERQALLELAAARGVPLSESRAARAVRAGRGAELRRRLVEGSVERDA